MATNAKKMTEREVVTIGKTMETLAIKLASKSDDNLTALVVEQMEAKETLERGPILVFLALEKAYGQELAAFPRPGSTWEETDNPDVFKVSLPDGKGGERVVKRNFYQEFADNTKEGATILQELKWLKLLGNNDADPKLVPADFRNTYDNPEIRDVRESYLKQRRSTIKNAYRKAVGFGYQFDAIESLEKVTISYRWADKAKGVLENTKTPIRLASAVEGEDKWGYFSVSQVMRMNVPAAMEQGGTFQALKDTMKREGDEGQGGDSNIRPRQINTPETFSAAITDIHFAVDHMLTDASGRPLYAGVKKLLEGPGSDDAILSMYDIAKAFNEMLYANDKMSARVEKVVAEREEQRKQEAA